VEPNNSVQVNLNNFIPESVDGRVRLLIWLYRYIDGLGRRRNPAELDRQKVAILTAIQLGEEHPECMLNQTKLAALFDIGTSSVSGNLTENLKGLCRPLKKTERRELGINDNRSKYFRLTPQGKKALADHAAAHDLPFAAYRDLQRTPEYQIVARRSWEILERELIARFLEVHRQ